MLALAFWQRAFKVNGMAAIGVASRQAGDDAYLSLFRRSACRSAAEECHCAALFLLLGNRSLSDGWFTSDGRLFSSRHAVRSLSRTAQGQCRRAGERTAAAVGSDSEGGLLCIILLRSGGAVKTRLRVRGRGRSPDGTAPTQFRKNYVHPNTYILQYLL